MYLILSISYFKFINILIDISLAYIKFKLNIIWNIYLLDNACFLELSLKCVSMSLLMRIVLSLNNIGL